jgi:hypothetical protein
VTEFIGYRVWRVANPAKGLLMAAHMDYRWTGPVLTIPGDDIADIQDRAGFHSFRTREQMEAYGGSTAYVRGTVKHYGVVAEYENGFRSTSAIITRLEAPDIWDDHFRDRLADRYQCEVDTYTPPKRDAESDLIWRNGWAVMPSTLQWFGQILNDAPLKSDYILLNESPMIAKPTRAEVVKYTGGK